MKTIHLAILTCTLAASTWAGISAQQHEHSDMSDMADASPSMAGEHLHMDIHMKMTGTRQPTPADLERAASIVTTLRQALKKYTDYRVALDEGFRIFHPEIPQPQYHFTNYRNGLLEAFRFDASKPTSLLYTKTKSGYEL